MIKGVQDAGTITVTKHYIANEQEHGYASRFILLYSAHPRSSRQLSNSVIDSKTFNEVYVSLGVGGKVIMLIDHKGLAFRRCSPCRSDW